MTCQKCGAKTTDGLALCELCQKTATYSLTNIAAYYADLDLVPTSAPKRRSNTASDPTGVEAARIVRDPVSEVDDEAVNTLTTWARMLADDRPTGLPPRTVPDLAPWLTKHLPSIATLEWAGLFVAAMLPLERKLRKVAAKADTGQYVGTCENHLPEQVHDGRTCSCSCHLGDVYVCDVAGGCGTEYAVLEPEVCGRALYAPRGAIFVRCGGCGSSWDVRARRHQLVRAAEDELAPVAVIAHLAALWIGEPSVTKVQARIDQWVSRKKIKHVTTKVIDNRERRVYRVGDVLDLLTDTPSKTEEAATA